MELMALGRSWSGELLLQPHSESRVVEEAMASIARDADAIRALARATQGAVSFQGPELDRPISDAGDPKSVGWTFLLHKDDATNAELLAALAPLADHRGMAAPRRPLVFCDEPTDRWVHWLHEQHWNPDNEDERPPAYMLIVGGPKRVPFRFQSFLQSFAHVGRLDFDSIAELATYVAKVIRLETASAPVVDRKVVMFATDEGPRDPTFFSREFMVKPLAELIREKTKLDVTEIAEDDATKDELATALRDSRPALVYTASHGMGATYESLERQRRYNGAIVCHRQNAEMVDDLFGADDVPLDRPFLEGAVFFQFACFGYGTPARSDFAHWADWRRKPAAENSSEDFVAALPKKLLAHPHGPIGYVGHVDIALLHGFTDAKNPMLTKRWHSRIAPLRSAVQRLLAVEPAGLAMQRMNQKYAALNTILTNHYDDKEANRLEMTDDARARFVDNWLSRGDAQNFMVLGDPATRLRIPTGGV